MWLPNFSRTQKKLIAATADCIFLPTTFVIAILLRYDVVTKLTFQPYWWLILTAPIISIPLFVRLGLYRAVVRFVDQKIVFIVVLGVSISVFLLIALAALLTHMEGLSRGVFGIYWVSAISYVVASRFIVRGIISHPQKTNSAPRIAIYGTGKAAIQLAAALKSGQDYLPVAFIDDVNERSSTTIAGIKVYRPYDIPKMIARAGVTEILLAVPELSKSEQAKILDKLEVFKLKVKITPPIESLVNGELRLQDVRDIGIEDLLGRNPVAPDLALISIGITNKSVLVTGAGGSIGSELCRQILRLRPSHLLLLEMSEFALYTIKEELQEINNTLDLGVVLVPFLGTVLDTEKSKQIMVTFNVETVYHAAAYKHVPLVEHNPIEGVRNNVFGTLSIARAAMAANVSCFILISTDKAVRPTNVMGCTKRFAELILQAFARSGSNTRFSMVRFGNVLGSSGSVVPLFRKQILAGGPITLTHPEITRYFMTIPEAAQLVLQAAGMGQGGDVFVLDMGEPIRIMDLAERMVHLSGLEVKSRDTPDGIEIRHVGLRPGEKLYEELLIGDNVEGTAHPLIMRATEVELVWDDLEKLLIQLQYSCDTFAYDDVRKLLMKTVCEYTPQCGIEDFLWLEKNRISAMGPSYHIVEFKNFNKEQYNFD